MKVKAYKAYNARKANELSLNVDDIIEVEDKTSIDLWKGKLEKSGETGLFPTNCVVPLDGDISPPPPSSTNDHNHNKPGFVGKKPDLLDNLNDKKSSSTTTTSNGMFKQLKQVGGQKKDPAPAAARGHTPLESSLSGSAAATAAAAASAESAPKLPPKPVREQVRVIYGYKAQNEDELTIKEGEIITVISRDNEDVGWWKGELNGRIALFPDNFVEMIQPSPPPPLPRPAESDKLRIRKPDRGSPSAGGNSSTTTNSTSPAPSSESANPNTFASSVPIIGKMIKGFGNQSSNHKSSDTSQSSSVNSNGPNKLVDSQSSLTTDGDAKEDPFNAEPLSPSKLVHLTAQRPKIPSNQRRPPSLHLGKPSEFPDFMDTMEDSSPSEPQPPPKKLSNTSTENTNTNSNATNKIAPSSIALKPVVKPEPDASSSPEKKAPWLSELKKSQERRRTNELLSGSDQSNRKSMNGPPPAPAPSSKPHAPNPPTAKPFVSNSTKPSLVSPQTSLTANNTTNNNTTANNISPSSDHSPTNQQQQPQQHGATEASSIGHKSVSTGPVTISTNSNINSSNHHHHSINENVAPSVQSVNSHPSVGGVTSSSTASTITSTTTIVTNSNSNNSNNSNTNRHVVSTDSSSLSSSSPLVTLDAKALAARDEEMAKMRSEVNQLTETVAELRTTVTDLRKELAHQAASQKSGAEWAQQKAELDKQIHEQHSLFESHKKNLSDMVKELINELTEEKKKIAALQIELDRMRKLTTTV